MAEGKKIMIRPVLYLTLFVLFELTLSNCQTNSSSQKMRKDGWVKRSLSDLWLVELPPNSVIEGCGCTGNLKEPGNIYLEIDSVQITFFVNNPSNSQERCDLDSVVRRIKQENGENICKGDGPAYNITFNIDDNARTAAAFGNVVDSSKYYRTLQLMHCTHNRITFWAESFTPTQDHVVEEILKSVEFRNQDQ